MTNFLWRTPTGNNLFLQIPRNEGGTLDCLVGPLEVRESDRTVRVAGTQQRGSQATQWQGLRVSHSRVLCVRQWPTSFHQLAFSYTSVCNCIIATADQRDNPSLCEHQRCPHSLTRISTNPVHWEEDLGEEETSYFIPDGGKHLQAGWFQRKIYI